MKCTNCGENVPDIAKICGNCGHKLISEFSQWQYQQSNQQIPSQTPLQKKFKPGKSSNKKLLQFLFLILVLIGGIWGFSVLLGYFNNQKLTDERLKISEATNAVQVAEMNATGEARTEKLNKWSEFIQKTDDILDDFIQVTNKASGANRIEMPALIEDMEYVRNQALSLSFGSQYYDAQDYFIEMLDATIDGYTDWQAGGSAHEQLFSKYQDMRDGWTNELNKIDH